MVKHPSVLEQELPRLHWHKYYPDGLPEARACWYCPVVHRTNAEQRNNTKKAVSAWIKASSENKTLWMDKRAQVMRKYSGGHSARDIAEPTIAARHKERHKSRVQGSNKKQFWFEEDFREEFGSPIRFGYKISYRKWRGELHAGVQVGEAKPKLLELISEDEEEVDLEDVFEDGKFIVQNGQQQAVYNDVAKDMTASSSVSGKSMSMQELYARKALLESTTAAAPPQEIMSKRTDSDSDDVAPAFRSSIGARSSPFASCFAD